MKPVKRPTVAVTALGAALTLFAVGPDRIAWAQPAKGALAAFERVREVMNDRFRDMKLVGDPDKDFAALLIAHQEDLIFLARTELEHGGDQQLRQVAQTILDDQQKQISAVKEWQVRSRRPDYRARPDQAPHGSGPLDRQVQASPVPAPQAPTQSATPSTAASPLPLVSGKVEKVDVGAGKITIDHGPIPNLDMDSMTMVFRTQDPAIIKDLKAGDTIRFQADRVDGRISVIKIQRTK